VRLYFFAKSLQKKKFESHDKENSLASVQSSVAELEPQGAEGRNFWLKLEYEVAGPAPG
jgi:hypothetical protein